MTFRDTTWLIPDGCPCVTEGPDGDPYWRCGQGWGHDGDCTWWTPGGYLPPRLITVLDWFDAQQRVRGMPWWFLFCPICRRPATGTSEASTVIYCDAEYAERNEVRWRFSPCGCEGREFARYEAAPEP